MTLQPAYGRDYKSLADILADLKAKKDFIVADFMGPWSGKPVNLPQLQAAGIEVVSVRYAGNRKITRTIHTGDLTCA